MSLIVHCLQIKIEQQRNPQLCCDSLNTITRKAIVSLRPSRMLCNAWRLFVCFFVCSGVHEDFTTDVSVHKKELIKLWKSFASGSRSRKFLKDSSTLHISTFALYLRRVSHSCRDASRSPLHHMIFTGWDSQIISGWCALVGREAACLMCG